MELIQLQRAIYPYKRESIAFHPHIFKEQFLQKGKNKYEYSKQNRYLYKNYL